MRLRPDDAPEMELSEIRRFAFNLTGAVGVNSINSATITAPNLTFGTPTVSGSSVTVTCTAGATGTHMAKLTAALSSSETIIGVVRVKVVDSTCESSGRDY
jgi:hypothetical protein